MDLNGKLFYQPIVLRHLKTTFVPKNEGTMNFNSILNWKNVNHYLLDNATFVIVRKTDD